MEAVQAAAQAAEAEAAAARARVQELEAGGAAAAAAAEEAAAGSPSVAAAAGGEERPTDDGASEAEVPGGPNPSTGCTAPLALPSHTPTGCTAPLALPSHMPTSRTVSSHGFSAISPAPALTARCARRPPSGAGAERGPAAQRAEARCGARGL
eukprot:7386234-Prymnesium_polylepis.1